MGPVNGSLYILSRRRYSDEGRANDSSGRVVPRVRVRRTASLNFRFSPVVSLGCGVVWCGKMGGGVSDVRYGVVRCAMVCEGERWCGVEADAVRRVVVMQTQMRMQGRCRALVRDGDERPGESRLSPFEGRSFEARE